MFEGFEQRVMSADIFKIVSCLIQLNQFNRLFTLFKLIYVKKKEGWVAGIKVQHGIFESGPVTVVERDEMDRVGLRRSPREERSVCLARTQRILNAVIKARWKE